MYSMKEKYRQNTKLKSSTTSYSTSGRHHQHEDEYSTHHSSRNDRHRSPGMTKQDKYYEMMKKDRRDKHYSDDYERRGEKRSSRLLDAKYSRDEPRDDYPHRGSRADYREHDIRDQKSRRDREYSMEKKNSVFANLSQTIRKARENRQNGNADDEKNSKRWSHSGYKELYSGDRRRSDAHKSFRKGESSFRRDRSREFSRSRSRSPIGKTSSRNMLAPTRRNDEGLRSDRNVTKTGSSLKTPTKKSLNTSNGSKNSSGKKKTKDPEEDDDDLAVIKALREEREKLLAKGMKSPSVSGSVSSNSESGKRKPATGVKGRRMRRDSRSRSRSDSRSVSISSSSRSSDDEDVLELHPTKRRRTLSRSNSSSSYDSRSDSSGISCLASNSGRRSRSHRSVSSSSSSRSIGSHKSGGGSKDKEIDKSLSKTNKNNSKLATGSTQPGKTKTGAVGKDSAPSATKGLFSKTSKTTSAEKAGKKSSKSNAAKAKGTESNSDSDSSSDSDAEPRMSLSERFAKLTQMHTDKREFAKPVLSANEINTKLKVVRDLRHPDSRVLLDNQQVPPSSDMRRRSRPKTPDIVTADGARRYTSDDRRRHFERMHRDEPSERPADWSDPRVRYTYYRDRGYFNERPLTFEEYVKWEKWWYDYRDWLAAEGYYDRAAAAAAAAAAGGAAGPHPDARVPAEWNYGRRPEPHGVHGAPPPMYDARERLGRPPMAAPPMGPPHPVPGPRSDMRGGPYYPPPPRAVNRSIGRAPDGSLIINVGHGRMEASRGHHAAPYGYRGRSHGPGPY